MPENLSDLPVTERARRLRTDLRTALKNNRFEQFNLPEGLRIGVRTDRFSQGTSITVAVTASDEWAFEHGADGKQLTAAARKFGELMTSWLRQYNGRSWGDVHINGYGAGSVAREGFQPGDD
jgi:hypothetical protein